MSPNHSKYFQSKTADHPHSPLLCHCIFFFLSPPSVNPSVFLSLSSSLFLLDLISLLCYLSPSVPVSPLFLSCPCCLLPLLLCSDYITVPVSRLQILSRRSDEQFCPLHQGQASGYFDSSRHFDRRETQ